MREVMFHRITESLRLEKTSKIIAFNCHFFLTIHSLEKYLC